MGLEAKDIIYVCIIIIVSVLFLKKIDNIEYNCITEQIELINKYESIGCGIHQVSPELYINKPFVNGIYWEGTDFYCVRAEERELTAIQETEKHEYCHYLVYKDYSHFCE